MPRNTPYSPPSGPAWASWATLLVVLGVALAVRLWLFFGLSGSDDATYSRRGLEVALGLWLPSDYIGDLRYGMNLPIAASLKLLGMNTAGLAGWGLLCSLAEIALVYLFAERAWGRRAAVFAGLILIVIPIHLSSATNMWADAPFSFFLTTSALLLWSGVKSGRAAPVLGAGLACGLAGWVKPEPAVVFGLTLTVLALIHLRDRRQLLWIFAGGILAAIPNLILFAWAFGDPLYYLHAGTRNLQANFIENAAPWGDHSANYYFRQLFLDGRSFWLAPLLAVPGMALALFKGSTEERQAGRYTTLWAVLIVLSFSFFVYSLSPLRLIPKQQNYALIFAAPVALLAGLALARLWPALAMVILAPLVVGSLMLTTLDGYSRHLHGETNFASIRFARQHPDAVVFVGQQAANLNAVLSLMGRDHAANLRLLSELAPARGEASPLPLERPHFVAIHPNWPESRGRAGKRLKGESARCLRPMEEAVGTPNITESLVTGLVARLRSVLPAAIDRQVSFTDEVLKPQPVRFHALDSACFNQGATQLAGVRE